MMNAKQFFTKFGPDAADLLAELSRLECGVRRGEDITVDAEQDWENEATTFHFKAGGSIRISGPCVEVGNRTRTP